MVFTGVPFRRVNNNEQHIRVLQVDKSTNLIYLRKKNDLGYNGVVTKRLQNVIHEIESLYCVKLVVLFQPTHYFLYNANDALLFL